MRRPHRNQRRRCFGKYAFTSYLDIVEASHGFSGGLMMVGPLGTSRRFAARGERGGGVHNNFLVLCSHGGTERLCMPSWVKSRAARRGDTGSSRPYSHALMTSSICYNRRSSSREYGRRECRRCSTIACSCSGVSCGAPSRGCGPRCNDARWSPRE